MRGVTDLPLSAANDMPERLQKQALLSDFTIAVISSRIRRLADGERVSVLDG